VTQEQIERLHRRRALVERRSREVLRELERIERLLRHIEETVASPNCVLAASTTRQLAGVAADSCVRSTT